MTALGCRQAVTTRTGHSSVDFRRLGERGRLDERRTTQEVFVGRRRLLTAPLAAGRSRGQESPHRFPAADHAGAGHLRSFRRATRTRLQRDPDIVIEQRYAHGAAERLPARGGADPVEPGCDRRGWIYHCPCRESSDDVDPGGLRTGHRPGIGWTRREPRSPRRKLHRALGVGGGLPTVGKAYRIAEKRRSQPLASGRPGNPTISPLLLPYGMQSVRLGRWASIPGV